MELEHYSLSVQNRYYKTGLIKNKVIKHLKYITDLSLLSNSNSCLYLHCEIYINDIKFRFIIGIILNDDEYYFNLTLCIDSTKRCIKYKLKNEMELSYYVLDVKKNYKNILSLKKNLSNYILNNIKFNELFIQNEEGVLLVNKMKLVKRFYLPEEILDLIIIKLC